MGSNNPSIFRNLDADDIDAENTIIESLCVNCGENVSCIYFIYNIMKTK